MRRGLIGRKLSHSYSKDIHERLGYDYDLIEIESRDLDKTLHDSRYDGYNVTVPYKEEVISYLDEVTSEVSRIGACNTIVKRDGKLIGYNTDYYGLKALIQESGIDMKGASVLILGSGGTSKTARVVCEDMGATAKVVSRSGALNYDNIYDEAAASVIINATPYGMYPNITDKCLVDLARMPNITAVVDVIFNPTRTALVYSAKTLGIKAVSGLNMLIYQALAASELFTGVAPTCVAEDIRKDIERESQNIVLIGMPGCGKSSLGRMLSVKLNMELIDTDKVIERSNKLSCGEIITKLGENKFRDIESGVIRELSNKRGCVIAVGGGAIIREENRYYLAANSKVVYIDRALESLASGGRPLSNTPSEVVELFAARQAIYDSLCDVKIENRGDIWTVVDKIIGELGYEDTSN